MPSIATNHPGETNLEVKLADEQLQRLASDVALQLVQLGSPPLSDLIQRMGRLDRENPIESDPVRDLLDLLEEETGNSRRDLLIKSLSLFREAIRAEKQGREVAILDADDTIVDELVDFDAPLSPSLALTAI